ncbi:MAG: hypothetical protein K2X70_02790 [Candidatus Obscuribacterales bacterium]|jgi:hypothetical protein|nr:hypothetical protein [Candidatus Obscuribacterales bacterium]
MAEEISFTDRNWYEQDDTSQDDMKAVRDYAYASFDRLDKNGNGFIERSELANALHLTKDLREKSFIQFLLNNQTAISDMVTDRKPGPVTGISRDDLESYFTLVIKLLGG